MICQILQIIHNLEMDKLSILSIKIETKTICF